jgi:hypothetical protein
MSIIVARPPNFDAILKVFPDAEKPGVIFAYGADIYNPSGGHVPMALLMHEDVHQRRQTLGNWAPAAGPEEWWRRYLEDAEFRYREELLAHVAEYKAQLSAFSSDRNARAKLLQATAARLVAPLYNYQPPRTLSTAMRDLRWELEQ